MAKTNQQSIISDNSVLDKIYIIRGQRVMLDNDLAELYGVETRRLKEAVRRNISRFPSDFMFELEIEELNSSRSQFATLKIRKGQNTKYRPFAFTEQGVAMLSSVLNSDTAIAVNIQIIRVFTRMRQMLLTHKDILLQLEKIEKKLTGHDTDIALIFQYLKQLLNPPNPPREQIGFRTKNE